MKWKSLFILLVIIVSLIPVYYFNKWIQKLIDPRRSLLRLFAYLLTGLMLVFVYTFIVVFIIRKLFPGA